MNLTKVLNERVTQRGISVRELARRVGMNAECLRRSLLDERKLKATEFVDLCRELDLDIDDFSASAA